MNKLFSAYSTWNKGEILAERGILVGSDISQEWLLPWWWDHYRKTNNYPVTFVDFGMSSEAKEWCRERGRLISLPLSDSFVADKMDIAPSSIEIWERAYGRQLWGCRDEWFKKPFACLLSPFHHTIWIDLDCEVRGSLRDVFSLCESPSGIAIAKEYNEVLCKEGVNSGVVVFKRGLPLIELWAKEALESNHHFAGDQDILGALIEKHEFAVAQLPHIYNWSRRKEDNPDAVIVHWHGQYGKAVIAHQIFCSEWA
jgi:hypothetical protein